MAAAVHRPHAPTLSDVAAIGTVGGAAVVTSAFCSGDVTGGCGAAVVSSAPSEMEMTVWLPFSIGAGASVSALATDDGHVQHELHAAVFVHVEALPQPFMAAPATQTLAPAAQRAQN